MGGVAYGVKLVATVPYIVGHIRTILAKSEVSTLTFVVTISVIVATVVTILC